MNKQKFSVGSLVRADSEIFEITEIFATQQDFSYKVVLRAFTRDYTPSEWETQTPALEKIFKESEIHAFEFSKPGYVLGERVKLKDQNCIVRFIKFENYHFHYAVKANDPDGLSNLGWIVEESYLSR